MDNFSPSAQAAINVSEKTPWSSSSNIGLRSPCQRTGSSVKSPDIRSMLPSDSSPSPQSSSEPNLGQCGDHPESRQTSRSERPGTERDRTDTECAARQPSVDSRTAPAAPGWSVPELLEDSAGWHLKAHQFPLAVTWLPGSQELVELKESATLLSLDYSRHETSLQGTSSCVCRIPHRWQRHGHRRHRLCFRSGLWLWRHSVHSLQVPQQTHQTTHPVPLLHSRTHIKAKHRRLASLLKLAARC